MKIANYIFSDAAVEALGWTILHSLWQGALLAILLAILLVFMQKFSAKSRYLASVIFIGLFFFSVITTYIVAYNPQLNVSQINKSETELPGKYNNTKSKVISDEDEKQNEGALTKIVSQFKIYFQNHIPLIVTIWLMGMLILSLRFLGSLAYIQRIKHHKTSAVSEHWQNKVIEISKRLKLDRIIPLLKSPIISGPMVIGIFKPVILVPVKVITNLKEEQIEAIIAHELAHIKRNDFAVNILQSLIEIIFFYHPALWWMSSTVRNERENSCDDIAVAITDQKVSYAKALIDIQESQTAPYIPAAVYFAGGKNKFSQRIMRILNQPTIFADFKEGFITALIIISGILVITLSAVSWPNQEADVRIAQFNNLDLHQVVQNNHVELVSQMLSQGTYVDPKDDDGYTPLMRAVKNNNYSLAQLLIDHGANVNARNDNEFTILMESADEDDHRIAEILIDQGALVNQKDEDDWTALHEAVNENKLKIAGLLLENGADLELRDEDNRTPLILAVQKNRYQLTQLLLSYGADIHATNKDGWTVLMHAADEKDPQIAELLIQKGANVNAMDYSGWNALLEAVKHQKYDVTRLLLEHGAEVNVTHKENTPLRYAIKENNYLLTELLIEFGADVNAQGNKSGTTMLIEAADEDNHKIAELLLRNDAKVDGQRFNGWNALHEAIESGKNDIVQVLLQYGADVNWNKYNDLTPLMHALEEEDFEIIITLVENGADLNARRQNGWSVMDIARKTDEREIIDYISNQINKNRN